MSKSLIHFANCDFCGQDKTIIGTPHGCFCKECLRLMIDEFEGAIEDLEEKEFEDGTSWEPND